VFTGSCLCGRVQFRVDTEPQPIQVCYCQQCRKAQGAALVTNMPVPSAAFHITAGSELLKAYQSSPGKDRVFCSNCGSPIYSKTDKKQEVVRIRAGTVNEPLSVRPVAHFHVSSKPNWWTITDELPQFSEGYVPGKA
jgi:hypothetical protein